MDQFNKNNNSKLSMNDFFQLANQSIINESKKRKKPMGSTLSAISINTDTKQCQIGSIGDSRVYLFNDTTWKTNDDTLVQELIDMGILNEEQAFNHEFKHKLNQVLGIKKDITIETHKKKLNKSTILLSTDGLHDYVEDKTIKKITLENLPEKACDILIKQARKNKSTDDITIIIIKT